jgi:glycosyltransferase involved in cell wall biosynthesis
MPKVSVLIPTYNSAQFLDETIQSVLSQTFPDYEIIIVDNQSTDNTDKIIEKYKLDSRIRYYKNSVNIGMTGNWNQCLLYANGEYIKFLMSDDKFHPHLLEKFINVMDKNPDVSVITCLRQFFGEENSVIPVPEEIMKETKLKSQNAIAYTIKYSNWIGEPTSVMFRREHLWLGFFKIEMQWIPDLEMWLRLLTRGSAYIIPEVLSFFRQHPSQQTKFVTKNFLREIEEYEYFRSILYHNDIFQVMDRVELKKQIKERAVQCGCNIFQMIRLKNYYLAQNALEICYHERVFIKIFIRKIKSMRTWLCRRT